MSTEETATTNNSGEVISTKDWVITLLIAAIPLVNIIMLFVWGFGGNTPESKANWAKATLIWAAIGIGLYLLIFLIFGAAMMSGMN